VTALILAYHAVEPGPPPLCIEPELFESHAAAIAASGAMLLTVSEVAAALQTGGLPESAVAITFDDGCASVAERAAPILAARGLRGTVFCVAGRLGGLNDWPTQPPWAPRLRLADAGALAALASDGWEIGSHGLGHAPLDRVDPPTARREVVESREQLEEKIGAAVSSFAWPYGCRPGAEAAALLEQTYRVCCGRGPGVVRPASDVRALPRVDAHYLRDPELLSRALRGSAGLYLAARRVGAGARRLLRRDYVWAYD
jgi:peptidoglycan/xylan/chitin deacetylase (PgdA/CDA1 family)